MFNSQEQPEISPRENYSPSFYRTGEYEPNPDIKHPPVVLTYNPDPQGPVFPEPMISDSQAGPYPERRFGPPAIFSNVPGSSSSFPDQVMGTPLPSTDQPGRPHHRGLFGSIKDNFAAYAEKKAQKKANERQAYIQECIAEENHRWGSGSRLDLVRRYQAALGISHIAAEYGKSYLDLLRKGYFEPIPLAWSTSDYNPLTAPLLYSNYDDAAEERLYWVLNNSYQQGKPRQPKMLPTEAAEMAMAYKRMRKAQKIDMAFASDGDLFRSNPRYLKKGYTPQVPKPPIAKPFVEMQHLAHNGTIEVDTMILLDVSSSMGWDHQGFDQPRHVDVVHNILRRAIYHMGARDYHPDRQGHRGVETVLFNSTGYHLGKVGPENFEQKWGVIQDTVYRGGGTQVMKGWQMVKNLHFKLHGGNGRAWYDDVYGWQATAEMPKLSLLVMLDGEASDMDEFELELLGETWCYATIVLIGQDNCPHHHRHANELDRISTANEHVQYYDCHGRLCERLVVYDVLQRVYAENAPNRKEILNPSYDIEPPAYHP